MNGIPRNQVAHLATLIVELLAANHFEAVHELRQSHHPSMNHAIDLFEANCVHRCDFHLKIVSPTVAPSYAHYSWSKNFH